MSDPIHWLIDAHNVLHRDARLRPLMGEPEKARAQLEALLAGAGNMLLFYDGGPGGRASTTMRGGLRIEYSGTEDADARIIRWLKQHPGTQAVVVSDDREVRAQARNLGAKLLHAEAFLKRFRTAKSEAAEKPEPTEAEVRMWMEIFEDAEDEP